VVFANPLAPQQLEMVRQSKAAAEGVAVALPENRYAPPSRQTHDDPKKNGTQTASASVPSTLMIRKHYKEALEIIYSKHNPSELKDVDGILAMHQDEEQALLEAVCHKYGIGNQSQKKGQREWFCMQLRAVYGSHNPEKLNDISDLLNAHKGWEVMLLVAVWRKYQQGEVW
jgi:hypothetical protein